MKKGKFDARRGRPAELVPVVETPVYPAANLDQDGNTDQDQDTHTAKTCK